MNVIQNRRVLYTTLAALVVPATGASKDLGMFYGEPTPALAMYIAQVNFAVPQCLADNRLEDVKGANKLLRHFNNGMQHRIYRKKDDDFVAQYDTYFANYSAAWESATAEEKSHFCDEVNAEIATKNDGFIRFATAMGHMRDQFSPITEATRQRAHKWAAVAAVAGGVLSATASVAATDDAVSSARSGNALAARQQFAAAQVYSKTTSAFGHLASGIPANANHGYVSSVLEVAAQDGVKHVIRCPVVDHFFSYGLPADSGIWKTYHRVSMPCRNPDASDVLVVQEAPAAGSGELPAGDAGNANEMPGPD